MKKIIVCFLCLLAMNSCNSENKEKSGFEKLIENVKVLDSFPFIEKTYVYNPPTLKLNEENTYKYLKLKRKNIYYTKEFYNHDEDIRTFGEEKPCFPIITAKYKNTNFIALIIAEYSGLNDGDIENTYLYTFDIYGKKISKVLLKNEMITYDGIPFTAFCLIDKNHFNTYVYNLKDVEIEGKKKQKINVEVKKYVIKDNGTIEQLNSYTQDEHLQKGDYQSNNPKKWPSNDPMKLLFKK